MVLWALAILLRPDLLAAGASTTHLMLGLAVVAAALLVALAIAGVATAVAPRAGRLAARRTHTPVLPRLLDPDAPGRPRPRAPSAYPAAV
jgi:hypothetical protein